MKPISNGYLINTAILTVVLIGLAMATLPSLDAKSSALAILGIIGISVAVSFSFSWFNRRFPSRDGSFWGRPVSDRTGVTVMNICVISWLVIAASLVALMVVVSHSAVVFFIATLCAALSLITGHLLRRVFSSNSLAAYGISSVPFLGILVFSFVMAGKAGV